MPIDAESTQHLRALVEQVAKLITELQKINKSLQDIRRALLQPPRS